MTNQITERRNPWLDFVRNMGRCVEPSGPDVYVKERGGIQFVERPGRWYLKRGEGATLHSTFVECPGLHRLVTLLRKIWLRLCGYHKVTGISALGRRALFFKEKDIPEFIRHVELLSGINSDFYGYYKRVLDRTLHLLINRLETKSGCKYPNLRDATNELYLKLSPPQNHPTGDCWDDDLFPPFPDDWISS